MKLKAIASVFLCVAWYTSDIRGSEPVELRVILADGSVLQAELDPRTDEDSLKLRFQGNNVVIVRTLRWSRVLSMTSHGDAISASQILGMVEGDPFRDDGLAASSQVTPANFTQRETIVTQRPVRDPWAEGTDTTGKLSAVNIHAESANWDSDADVDGLVVRLYPIDDIGRPKFVRGIVRAELFGLLCVDPEKNPGSYGSRVTSLGSWVIPVDNSTKLSNELSIRLPYSNVSPYKSSRWAPVGRLVLEVVVAGENVVSTTLDEIVLRPYSFIGDTRQLQSGSRLLPAELRASGRP